MRYEVSFLRRQPKPAVDADGLLAAAREGDASARDQLIRNHLPFILKVAAKICGRYVQMGQDDEVSVGLMAFNEAVDSYRPNSGAAFTTFAEMVIRRRLIDYFRREGKRLEAPLSEYDQEDEDGDVWSTVELRSAVAEHAKRQEAQDRGDEVIRYRAALAWYGIPFEDLVRVTPRHRDARERAIMVARRVAGNARWSEYLKRTHSLPSKELAGDPSLGVSRKLLERQRKYIIAVALVFMEGLEGLQAFVPEVGEKD